MTPVEITTLLHIYAIEEPLRSAPAVSEAVENFKKCGAIETDPESGSNWSLTAKGLAWVYALLATPQPVLVYLDPRTNTVLTPQ